MSTEARGPTSSPHAGLWRLRVAFRLRGVLAVLHTFACADSAFDEGAGGTEPGGRLDGAGARTAEAADGGGRVFRSRDLRVA